VLVGAPDLDLPPDFAGDGMMAPTNDYSICRKLNALLESTNDDKRIGLGDSLRNLVLEGFCIMPIIKCDIKTRGGTTYL
jgi:hypothetical protein